MLAVVTQYTMLLGCNESRHSVSASNVCLLYKLMIKYRDEYFRSLSRDVVVTRLRESSKLWVFRLTFVVLIE